MVRYHNSGTQKFDDTEHDSVNTEVLSIPEGESLIQQTATSAMDSDATTTSTSYTQIAKGVGGVNLDTLPSNATVYGRFYVRGRNSSTGDKIYFKPQIRDTNGNFISLDALEVTTTSQADTGIDSGWVELNIPSGVYRLFSIRSKSDGGEAFLRKQSVQVQFRVDL